MVSDQWLVQENRRRRRLAHLIEAGAQGISIAVIIHSFDRSLSTRLIAQLIVRLILAMYVINDNVTTLLQDKAYQGGSVDMLNTFELFLFGV